MASLDQPAPNLRSAQANAGKKPRARKLSFRPDMTPMVDLAFLLLTFFMLTTTFAKPRVMPLTMPVKDHDHPSEVGRAHAMTIVLGAGHRVYYYLGLNAPYDPTVPAPTVHTTDFSAQGIRQALLARGRQLPEPVVLIAAGPRATYGDMVNVLDELNITNQKKYALVALAAADRQLLPASERQ